MKRTWKRYTSSEIHDLLCERQLSDTYQRRHVRQEDGGFIYAQALFCPYYVPLLGDLGMDWGVIVNPESPRFGLVTFEHDWCGCPDSALDDGPTEHHGTQSGRDWQRKGKP